MRLISTTLCLMLLLSGCGIKPGDVSPPQGEEKDQFPRAYPEPSTDPNPHRYIR